MSHGVQGQDGQRQPSTRKENGLASSPKQMQVLSSASRVQILGRLEGKARARSASLADAIGMEALSRLSPTAPAAPSPPRRPGERRGKQVIYGLHDPHVAELLDQAVFHVEQPAA